jgi:hypothetical protein
MIAETVPLEGPLKVHGVYRSVNQGQRVRIICVNRGHSSFKVVGLVQKNLEESLIELNSFGQCKHPSPVGAIQLIDAEFTGFYRGDPPKPGAYWCETISDKGKNAGWRWWDGEVWGMAWPRKTDCRANKMGTRKSSRKLPLRWRIEK